ncbi:FKBP12-associated protein 1 [Thelohanellus kitauei]|uniref:FKBP12-associated protein 1 n=1 Tax=Thelohanellus kitauei TaxID=669202 RepID=A0A0C2N7T9_THEKT|nr:FKBP12-associated protein 1 [Thelohanellus kitauei]
MRSALVIQLDLSFNRVAVYHKKLEKDSKSSCSICSETIEIMDQIWSCDACRSVAHFNCAKTRARNQQNDEDEPRVWWTCPNCENKNLELPSEPYCYCGKTENPEWDMSLGKASPHCCLKTCGRLSPAQNGAHCNHPCELQCHSGVCPPCDKIYKYRCWCGTNEAYIRCGYYKLDGMKNQSCGKTCSKLLRCGKHKCRSKCHSGSCPPCQDNHVKTFTKLKNKLERLFMRAKHLLMKFLR